MAPRRIVLGAALALTLSPLALADELKPFEPHPIQGQENGRHFQGHVDFHHDATFSGERVYDNGQHEALSGRVRIDQRDFVLEAAPGSVTSTLAGASASPTRVYARLKGKDYRWRYDDPADADYSVLQLPCREHLSRALLVVLGRSGTWNWLFNHNLGYVDREPGLEILRSKQPKPSIIQRWQKKYGLKAVLSLNGAQDQQVEVDQNGQRVKMSFHDYLLAQGIAHDHVSMSAQRAPTDAELVSVFRVLLDDSKKPLLIHCHGGSDRTGVISALYEIEFLGWSKEKALKDMRHHLWAAMSGTEIQGAYVELYQPGTLRRLLAAAGVAIPARYHTP